MSRTSQALRRLGVAGVVAVTIGAGLPALLATSASAADATTLTITPATGSAAAGTCRIFTVTATDSNGNPASYTSATPTINVDVNENPATTDQQVRFCDITAPYADVTNNDNGIAGVNNGDADTERSNSDQAEFETAALARTTTTANGVTTTSGPTVARFGLRGLTAGGANIRAFIDTSGASINNNGSFDAGEVTSTSTTTFTAGGINTADNESGGNNAQDAVRTITDASTSTVVTAGTPATFTVQLTNAAGDTVSGVRVNARVTSGPNAAIAATTTTPAVPAADVTCSISNNAGLSVCQYSPNADRTGTDTFQVWVNNTTGTSSGPEAGEPQLTITRTVGPRPNTDAAAARNINLSPESTTTVAGDSKTFTAVVTDVNARPVVGVAVSFTEEGPGRFSNGTSSASGTTDSSGTARVVTTSVAGETGTEIITAAITTAGTQCSQAAGAGTAPSTGTAAAGNCADTSTQTFSAASPSPSASASSSASPSPSATSTVSPTPSSPIASRLGISVSPATITPGVQSVVTVTGTPGSIIELQAYSRPNTTYGVVRRGTIGENGTIIFRVLPGTNTRLFAAVTGQTGNESPSVVINVRTALSLTVVRNGSGDYTFQGRILPRRAGQLITLYRVDNGREIITSQIKTDNTGTYFIRRVFVGQGIFGFLTRTGQTLTNAAGVSNNGQARPTAIYFGPQR